MDEVNSLSGYTDSVILRDGWVFKTGKAAG